MVTRSLNEQIGDDNALRIHLAAEAARALRVSGRASNYYLRELADCLDSGLFLAHGEGSQDWAFLASELESPERRADKLDEFVNHHAEEIATFVVNFIARRAIPPSQLRGLTFRSRERYAPNARSAAEL